MENDYVKIKESRYKTLLNIEESILESENKTSIYAYEHNEFEIKITYVISNKNTINYIEQLKKDFKEFYDYKIEKSKKMFNNNLSKVKKDYEQKLLLKEEEIKLLNIVLEKKKRKFRFFSL